MRRRGNGQDGREIMEDDRAYIDAGNPMFSKTKGWFERTKSVKVQSGTGPRCALVTAEEE